MWVCISVEKQSEKTESEQSKAERKYAEASRGVIGYAGERRSCDANTH